MNKTPQPRHSIPATRSAPTGQETAGTLDAPRYASGELFHSGDRIWIEHNGERYSLRITRQKKLILTK
jgi:hemin uptake protein HemP